MPEISISLSLELKSLPNCVMYLMIAFSVFLVKRQKSHALLCSFVRLLKRCCLLPAAARYAHDHRAAWQRVHNSIQRTHFIWNSHSVANRLNNRTYVLNERRNADFGFQSFDRHQSKRMCLLLVVFHPAHKFSRTISATSIKDAIFNERSKIISYKISKRGD